MRKTNILISLLYILLGFTVYLSANEEAPGAQYPELPRQIWKSILSPAKETTILRCRFGAFHDLPEMQLFLKEGKNLASDRLPFLEDVISELPALEPVEDSLDEVWTISGWSQVYGKSALAPDEIVARYQSWGWKEENEEGNLLIAPLTDEDEKNIENDVNERRKLQEEAEAQAREDGIEDTEESADSALIEEKIRERYLRNKSEVFIGAAGWICILPPYSRTASLVLHRPDSEEIREDPRFPFADILDPDSEDLCRLAVVFPEKQDPPEDRQGESSENRSRQGRIKAEINKLNREIARLEDESPQKILDRLGDMLIRLNEIDGGLLLEVEAEVPRGPDESLTKEAVQMAFGFLRMLAVSKSPELARELLNSSVSVSRDFLKAGVSVSHASLMDYFEKSAAINRHTAELNGRLRTLRRELLKLREQEADSEE